MKPLSSWCLGGNWASWWAAELSDPIRKLFLSKALYLWLQDWMSATMFRGGWSGREPKPPTLSICDQSHCPQAHSQELCKLRKWHCTTFVYFSGILNFLRGCFCVLFVSRAFFFSLQRKLDISGFKTIPLTFIDILQFTEYYPPWL